MSTNNRTPIGYEKALMVLIEATETSKSNVIDMPISVRPALGTIPAIGYGMTCMNLISDQIRAHEVYILAA